MSQLQICAVASTLAAHGENLFFELVQLEIGEVPLPLKVGQWFERDYFQRKLSIRLKAHGYSHFARLDVEFRWEWRMRELVKKAGLLAAQLLVVQEEQAWGA